MWAFMELKELLLLICISQFFSAQIWRVRQLLTQPASGSGITFTIRASLLNLNWWNLTFGLEWRFGEAPSNETWSLLSLENEVLKALVLWMDALIMSINDSCLRFTEMVRCQMVIMRTVGIWRMTGCLLYIILSLLPLSLSSFWWSSSANKSLSENIDRENWISGWHRKLLKTECMRYLNLINLRIKL